MGVDYNVVLGPYIQCTNTPQETEREKRTCPNKKCKMHGREFFDKDTKFCQECGKPIEKIKIKEMGEKVEAWEIAEKLKLSTISGEFKLPKNTDLFIGNKRDHLRKTLFDAHDEQLLEVSAEMIATELATFADDYSAAIAKLRELYGADNVTLKWGLIQYGS
jgi:hypothetical protein